MNTSDVEDQRSFDPCPAINITLEEAEKWCRSWKQTLIVRLLGKKISLRMLQNSLGKKWSKKGPIKVIDISEDYFLVHFNHEEDYKYALLKHLGCFKITISLFNAGVRSLKEGVMIFVKLLFGFEFQISPLNCVIQSSYRDWI